jgi:hypothetical protein
VIAAIQLSALIYGSYALYQVHPVFVTFNIDRFTLVNARDAQPEKAQYDEYKVSKLTVAKFAFAQIPNDIKKRNDLLLTSAMGGADLDQRIDFYEPYKDNIPKIVAKSLNPELIFKNNDTNVRLKKFVSKHHDKLDSFIYLPLNTDTKNAVIVLDRLTATPIATLDINPWELSKK